MNYLPLVFFASLVGVMIMIYRKVNHLREGRVLEPGEFLFEIPTLADIRAKTAEKTKVAGELGLIGAVKFYLHSSNLFKALSRETKAFVKKMIYEYYSSRNKDGEHEASKFLKMVGEYKQKVRKIKRKIEEEGIK